MPCTPARDLPEGRHLIRVLPQALTAEVGPEEGCWRVPSGWYYTDTGRSRVSAAVDVWQARVADMEAKVTALEVAVSRPAPPPPPPALFGPAHLFTLWLGLSLGWLGRSLLTRRTPR